MSKLFWPLANNRIRRGAVSNSYGTFATSLRSKGYHDGWDLFANSGTPCYAISDGVIDIVYGSAKDTSKYSYGLVIVLKFKYSARDLNDAFFHGPFRQGANDTFLYATYCHLSAAAVASGQSVRGGQLIGFTGTSGNAHGMVGPDQHLHFEIRTHRWADRHNDKKVDSKTRISPRRLYGTVPLADPVVARQVALANAPVSSQLDIR